MGAEVMEADIVLPTHMSFKKIQMYDKYPKGQSRGRHWKHLKQILLAENYQNYPPDEPTYVNIESPPSIHPCKKICDITGYEAPYYDPRTNLRYANAEVFKLVLSLPNEYVQRYLALRNAAVVLKLGLVVHPNKGALASSNLAKKPKQSGTSCGVGLDKEKVLKVSWEKIGVDYTAERLKEILSELGKVEDVVIKSSKKKGSPLVEDVIRDAEVTAKRKCWW